jgi:hypothetical protein
MKQLKADGSKGIQTDKPLDIYRKWRINWDRRIGPVMDIDQVEFEWHYGNPFPVAVFEMTEAQWPPKYGDTLGPGYFAKILHRIFVRDKQGQNILMLADLLGVPAYIVAWATDLKRFWTYPMNDYPDAVWIQMSDYGYMHWVSELHARAGRDEPA